MNKTTKELYGISDNELNAGIGKAILIAQYDYRIRVLKGNLAQTIKSEGITSHNVEPIQKAIYFWSKFKEDLETI